MAFKGHKRQGYCLLTITPGADGAPDTETPGTGVITSHVVSFTGSNGSDATELYAGDTLEESEDSATGSVQIGLSQLSLKDEAALGGHSYSEEDGILEKEEDSAPYVRYAAIGVGTRNGKTFYRLVGYYKVKFSVGDDDFATKEKAVSFKTHTASGTTFTNAEGKRRMKKDFDSFDAALAAMKTFLNITK